ncbi:MAG: tetratricopeptide repeat protein, partial [Polyangiales bacterium]
QRDDELGRTALGTLTQSPGLQSEAATQPASPASRPAASTKPEPAASGGITSTARPAALKSGRTDTTSSTPDDDAESPRGRAQRLVSEGTELLGQGRLGLAESAFQRALRASPDYPGAVAALVRVHLARHDGAEALRWAERLVATMPNDGTHQLLLGDARKLRGNAAGARDAWTEAARRGNSTARDRLAE